MKNQTFENEENNRGENKKTNLENELRSLWQESEFVNQTFLENDIKINIQKIRALLEITRD